MKREQVPAMAPGIVWRLMDDGAVLVSPDVGRVRVLNDVGTTIWTLIDGKSDLTHIEEALVQKYNVSRDRARQDLHAFLDDLVERDLIVWQSSGSIS